MATFGDKKVAKSSKYFSTVKYVIVLLATTLIMLQLFYDHKLLGDAR